MGASFGVSCSDNELSYLIKPYSEIHDILYCYHNTHTAVLKEQLFVFRAFTR